MSDKLRVTLPLLTPVGRAGGVSRCNPFCTPLLLGVEGEGKYQHNLVTAAQTTRPADGAFWLGAPLRRLRRGIMAAATSRKRTPYAP